MVASASLDLVLNLGLYSLWVLPFVAVAVYLRLFIDRYTVSLKSVQSNFEKRMANEEDVRRTRKRMKEMADSMAELNAARKKAVKEFNFREMDPEQRVAFAIQQGMILNLMVPTNLLRPGFITAEPIVQKGEVLLPRGAYLNGSLITQLGQHGIPEVSVMFHPDNPLALKLLNSGTARETESIAEGSAAAD